MAKDELDLSFNDYVINCETSQFSSHVKEFCCVSLDSERLYLFLFSVQKYREPISV